MAEADENGKQPKKEKVKSEKGEPKKVKDKA
jgi:hypothetical protein